MLLGITAFNFHLLCVAFTGLPKAFKVQGKFSLKIISYSLLHLGAYGIYKHIFRSPPNLSFLFGFIRLTSLIINLRVPIQKLAKSLAILLVDWKFISDLFYQEFFLS